MPDRRASVVATTAVVTVVGLLTLLVAWAATVGSGALLTGGPGARGDPSSVAAHQLGRPPSVGGGGRYDPGDHPWATAFLVVVVAVVALGVLALLVVLLRGLWHRVARWWARRDGAAPPLDVDFDVLDGPGGRVARSASAAARHQRDALAHGGSARNAIVECWHRFEEVGAEAGFERHPWETSSEFTLRMLDAAEVDGAAAARLAALYREARFSAHPLGEPARAAALEALDEVHESLRVRALFRAGGVT